MSVTTLPLIGHRLLGYIPNLSKEVEGYDLLHVHDPQLAAISLNLLAVKQPPRRVLSTHGGFRHTANLSLLKAFHSRITAPIMLSGYTRVLASSLSDQRAFSATRHDTVLAENGVDVRGFAASAHVRPRPLNRWISWGRLSKNKRAEKLIDLVETLNSSGREIDLLICGSDFDGLSKGLRNSIRNRNLAGQITLRDSLSGEELRAEIESRGVFITATEYEGFGLSIVEAMAAGLLIACRDIEPINAFIAGGGAGVFIAFDGSENDKCAIEAFLDMPEECAEMLRRRGQEDVSRFDWNGKAEEFLQHYRNVLGA
jgi:alpha-1,3-mannosyltransferase